MNGLNRATLVGNLCADPELRFTQAGQPVLNLRMATNERYYSQDEWKERVDYHNVVVWGKRGEALSKFLNKGTPVLVEGGIRTSSYEDKDGVKRYKTEINANEVILLGGRRGDSTSGDSSDSAGDPSHGGGDDIPF